MPRPWKARGAISWPAVWLMPATIEPSTNTTIAIWTRSFLLYRSASLPQIGVEAVAVSSVAVTTQVYCVWLPFGEPMIFGSAVETMVELAIATKSTSRRPESASMISRWDIAPGSARVMVEALIALPPGAGVGWHIQLSSDLAHRASLLVGN